MRVNLFLRSHTMLYTYCLLLLLAHRSDGSYYALWFLPRAAFWCLFAPPFAHARSQRGDTLGLSLGDPTIPTDHRLPICNAEPKRPWRKFLAHSFPAPLFPRLKLRCRHDLDGGSFIFNNGCPSQLPIYFFAAEPNRTVWLAIQPESESAFVNVQFKTHNCTFGDRASRIPFACEHIPTFGSNVLTQGADEPAAIPRRSFIPSYSVPYYTKKDTTIILIVGTEFE